MGRNSHDAAIFPQDEIGPPFCLKVDDETANDNCVTLRDRDSLKQERIPVAEIVDVIRERLKNRVLSKPVSPQYSLDLTFHPSRGKVEIVPQPDHAEST